MRSSPFGRSSLLLALLACSAVPVNPTGGEPSPTTPLPVLPSAAAELAPSQASVDGGTPVSGRELSDVSVCATCHEDVVDEWRTSAHAFASFDNPIYRVSVDRFRDEVGRKASRFCAGCHDVALLVDGAMDVDVASTDARAFAGVTCRTCHGIVEARPDGNASYVLAASSIPLPDMSDPASIARHKERAAPTPLRTPELCGTCHRAFLDETTGDHAFLAGMDEFGAWSRSGYAGSKLARIDDPPPASNCQTCHMAPEEVRLGDVSAKGGKIRSHRFSGGHTWLAAMRGDRDALSLEREKLTGAASIDLAVATTEDGDRTMPADGAPVRRGERILFDIVVRNQRVGHRFPGGTLDAGDTWIELAVLDPRGRLIAEAGKRQEASGEDPTAHVLHAVIADDDGVPLLRRETDRFRAVVYDHTIAPRDAELARYAFDVPASLDDTSLPLRVVATLRHRSHGLTLQRVACDGAKTARGRAFTAATKAALGSSLDPCEPQPVTEVAEAEAFIGAGSEAKPGSRRPAWRRLFEHGLAEQHEVEERLEEGRPSLEKALALVEAEGTESERAMTLFALAWLPAHEGRVADALERVDEAERLAPGHPALEALRGAALEQVWRWGEALGPLRAAVEAAPRDDRAAARLAIALGSAGSDAPALAAARRGLYLAPRDPDLLRVQALSLLALGAPAADADAAEQAYLSCRPADDAPSIRSACAARDAGCALERLPVHVHVMRGR
jgi:tetratricopeptide (TPR) repeat protein